MLSVTRSTRSCPQCRRQAVHIFAKAFTRAQHGSPAIARYRPSPSLLQSATSLGVGPRAFSTTRTRCQDTEPNQGPYTPPLDPEDIELVVRQARQAFGDTLPRGYLNDNEYKLYLRLYGPPLRETRPEDVGMPIPHEEIEDVYTHDYSEGDKIVLRENDDGQLEEIVYETETTLTDLSTTPSTESIKTIDGATVFESEGVMPQELPSEAGLNYIGAVAKSQREFDALLRLQRDFETSSLMPPEEDVEEEDPREEEEEEDEEEEREEEEQEGYELGLDVPLDPHVSRIHEFSSEGHWGPQPSTIQLPRLDFVAPITKLLDRTDIKHVKEAAEKALGGPGLPLSVATPVSKRNTEQKAIPMASNHYKMSEIEADAFVATLMPAMYSTSMSVLVEIRKRLGTKWMQDLMVRGNGEGPRVLDVGTGGAALAAWERILDAESALYEGHGKKAFLPPGRKTAVVGSEPLRQRVSRFLQNTTFLPRLPDYIHSGDLPNKLEGGEVPLPRKQFDIIIASHQVLPLKESYRRKAMIDNLWELLSPEGGILIVLEKGHPRGFEAVADVRARLLDEFIVSPNSDPQLESIETEVKREREPGMIIAPCTNHKSCPMYLFPGLTPGRKDFCHFSQRYIRPPFLQKVLGATHRNHEDVNFSFVAVQRGTPFGTERGRFPAQGHVAADSAFHGYENSSDAPDTLSLPRNVLPPIKRQGHVTMDLCTPAGTLERWTVPKSFSKQAYRDARKASWGDLWALGAKTRVVRPVRLGKGGPAPNDGGMRAQRAAQSGKARVISLDANASGIFRATEQGKGAPPSRRTKGGKKGVRQNLMKELGLEQ